ncbi:MAG: hypothetical protein F6K10_37745, partial [Moorea sp. SIO2B7]|nr:hypothetical protein [Moorena sp. SIO2B7]
MTNSSPNNSPDPRNTPRNPLILFFQGIKRHPKLAIGVTSIAFIVVGYAGLRVLIGQLLPPWLEKQLSETLNREVR